MTSDEIAVTVEKLASLGPIQKNEKLFGDASTRVYRRFTFEGGKSVIAMETDPAGVEEFSRTRHLFSRLGADTPQLIGANQGLLVAEDLGDELLQEWVDGMKAGDLEEEYGRIVDDLVDFQLAAREWADKSDPVFWRYFDKAKFDFENDHTLTHFLSGYLGIHLSPAWVATLETAWRPVVAELASGAEEVLCHRDFHSRNIMVTGKRRVWLDFQDARMGMMTYDLASLLWDPYVNMTLPSRDRLALRYYHTLSSWITPPWDGLTFRRRLVLSALQRLYKALGTYGYQTAVRKVDTYRPFIPRAAADLVDLLETEGESLGALPDILIPMIQKAV